MPHIKSLLLPRPPKKGFNTSFYKKDNVFAIGKWGRYDGYKTRAVQ
jgi:hypothetical protein